MIKLDDDLLQELGLAALPADEKKKLLAHIYETLEMRVGMKLAEQMSDAQLTEFEQFIDSNDESGALKWLEANFPNYKDVVASEFERLKAEIGQVAPQILAAGNQQQPNQALQQSPDTAFQQPPQTPGQPAPWQQGQGGQGANPSQNTYPGQPGSPQPPADPWGSQQGTPPPPPPPPAPGA
jgi:hypothetical protein